MTHSKSNDPYFCGYNEDDDTADYIVLKISVVVIAISNIVVNSLLIWKICTSKKRTRTNAMFLILIVSDLFVRLISLPMFSFTLFHLSNLPIYIDECNLNLFIIHLPLYCSWYWTVAIAIDRLFFIKFNIKYESVITKKILLRSLMIILIVFIGILIFFFNKTKSRNNYCCFSFPVVTYRNDFGYICVHPLLFPEKTACI